MTVFNKYFLNDSIVIKYAQLLRKCFIFASLQISSTVVSGLLDRKEMISTPENWKLKT
jgi:hypothetical protein